MAAGNEGAEKNGGFGLNIKLPFEQQANAFIDADKMLIHYKYFFTRKLFLVKEAHAFAFFPGGFGTLDEAFEVLTLLQTGKTSLIPIVMLEPKNFGFWKCFDELLDNALVKLGFVSKTDRNLFRVFNSPSEALDHITLFYKNYHSMRLVDGKLVLRLKRSVPKSTLQKIQKEYSLLSGGEPMVLGGPLLEEENEPELKDFVRLIFPFRTHDYGVLRSLVDTLNAI